MITDSHRIGNIRVNSGPFVVKKSSMTEPELKRVRMRRTMRIVCTALVLGAALLLVLPVRLPLPLRLALAFCDLVAASAVWLAGRQYFGGK
jgi:hypothetical protein